MVNRLALRRSVPTLTAVAIALGAAALPARAATQAAGARVLGPFVPPALEAAASERLFIVQMETPGVEALRARLRELGGEVLNYVPQHAYIVRMDPALRARVEAESFVRWVGAYEPAYRLES